MFTDDELLPISGLQHLSFCPRQCALIHLERLWSENYLTASGRGLHEKAHSTAAEIRGGVRTVRGLTLRSLRLGLYGVADVVEFHRAEETDFLENLAKQTEMSEIGSGPYFIPIPNRRGVWHPYPVEYKRGNPKKGNADAVQLCAQALCLEEMLQCVIPEGALFYGQARRRTVVKIDESLRAQTESLADEFHRLIAAQKTPPPTVGAHCSACSLREDCLPDAKKDALGYWIRSLREAGANE